MWITAAKLEEAQGNTENIDKIISRALKALDKEKVCVRDVRPRGRTVRACSARHVVCPAVTARLTPMGARVCARGVPERDLPLTRS